ncbi:MAG: phospholipid/cholesterol/gamma-HCH transport system substrate-binding protein [Actinomycetota bacterium]|nr:phospholipid/cholesterol/gamma-HCH transport system substrate-binding protein [Actinomycetota bacterium]
MITLLFLISASVFGVEVANGALRNVYHLNASFTAAGQGLIQQSDVKIHGVNIGRVAGVHLENGRALVRLEIDSSEKVPVDARAIIRPKTLFGEKFVDIDPGAKEGSGPFLRNNDTIKHTLGGFELEKILSELYPILKVVKPEELTTVIHTLAAGGDQLGPTVNRTLVNFEAVANVQARHAADTQQFLDDLAKLSGELADKSDDLVAAAKDLNSALPTLNQRGDELATFLDQAARLSGDVADVLEANKPFLQEAVTEGGKTLQLLDDNKARIGPLVKGLREFFEVLSEAGRIPRGDGTYMASIKLVFGESCPTGRIDGCGQSISPEARAAAAALGGGPVGGVQAPLPLPVPQTGVQGVLELLGGLLP